MVGSVLSCNSFSPVPTPTANPADCYKVTEPSSQDVQRTLEFSEKVFPAAGWQRSYTVGDQRVRVSWTNDEEGALAYWEYLLYACGYTSANLEEYFSAQNIKEVIFQSYQNLQPRRTCTHSNGILTLHEFTAELNDTTYEIRYWIKTDDETHILTVTLVFPQSSGELLDKYANDLFPELEACQN